jgi:hypothetical protein
MLESQKHVFWQALLITILIFSLGIIAGVFLESWRSNKVETLFQQSEIDLLDIRLQSEIFSTGKFNCQEAVKENLKFADRIYEEALLLEDYEKASRLGEELKLSHKKYDILRTILFLNSVKVKEKCNSSYRNVVYFYKFNNLDIDTKSKEDVFSKLLKDLKDQKKDDIILIPIAADNNLSSVNLMLSNYNLSQKDLPLILIDEKIKIKELKNINDLIKYFN